MIKGNDSMDAHDPREVVTAREPMLSSIGRTGIQVSKIGFGTSEIGYETLREDRPTVDRMIGEFIDRGGNFLDTADSYGGGWSEAVLGRALSTCRDSLIISTKVGMPSHPPPGGYGTSKSRIP